MEPPCIKLCRLLPLFTPRGGETGIQVTASLEIVITVLILITFSVDALKQSLENRVIDHCTLITEGLIDYAGY